MPEYVIITKKSIEFIYRHRIELPVDMGDSTTRLTDRMARKLAEDGVIPNIEADETDDSGAEEVSAIFRDNVQVWPRIRSKRSQKPTTRATKATQITFDGSPADGLQPETHEDYEPGPDEG